jgi:plastocyanin
LHRTIGEDTANTLLKKYNISYQEIARSLQVDKSVISKDVDYLTLGLSLQYKSLIYNLTDIKLDGRVSMRVKELLPLIAIISIILTIGGILIIFNLLPEQQVEKFNPLSEISIKTDLRVIKTPSPGDNTFVYALNDVAEQALHIAQNDTRVKQIIEEQKGKAVTIAAVQPTVIMEDRNNKTNGKATYNYPVGQIIITANWQYIDGKFYSNVANFNELENKMGESHQHIWNVFVDLHKRTVTSISEQSERLMSKTLQPNLVYAGMNMFMPDTVKINTGSVIKWLNTSTLPHNVVGSYNKTAFGSQQNHTITIDSGFIQPNELWKYNFNDNGVFEYYCIIHSSDGMKGMIIVS